MTNRAYLRPPTPRSEFDRKAVLCRWEIGHMFGALVVRGTIIDRGTCLPFHAEVWATQSNFPEGPRLFWTNRGPIRATFGGHWGGPRG